MNKVNLGRFDTEALALTASRAFHSELMKKAHDNGHYVYPGSPVPAVPPKE